MMENRKKAQDIFNDTNFVFAKKTTFDLAFPMIQNISLVVNEFGQRQRTHFFDKSSISEFINCSNPLCYNGGFNIGEVIREMVQKKETIKDGNDFCQGNEGSPKGRRIYRKCNNQFEYKINIEFINE